MRTLSIAALAAAIFVCAACERHPLKGQENVAPPSETHHGAAPKPDSKSTAPAPTAH